jgi:hypothetical protein
LEPPQVPQFIEVAIAISLVEALFWVVALAYVMEILVQALKELEGVAELGLEMVVEMVEMVVFVDLLI